MTLGDWAPLGGEVTLPVAPKRTVLVGRNGAGKSLILEGCNPVNHALLSTPEARGPARWEIQFKSSAGNLLRYGYSWDLAPGSEEPSQYQPIRRRWSEACHDVQSGLALWKVADELASFHGKTMRLPAGTGLLGHGMPSDIPSEARDLRTFFMGICSIESGVPRSSSERSELVIDRNTAKEIGGNGSNRRIVQLASTIGYWSTRNLDNYKEFIDLARRVGVLKDVDVKIYKDPSPSAGHPRDLAWIEIDGNNIGLLADGTLRVLETLADLVEPRATLLLIEEPETSIHPGLLHRLLAEIDAYTLDRQVILSTHSLIVVDWAHPSDIRLVERTEGRTLVRALDDREVADVAEYLDDQGTLADYIYGRSDA